MVKLPHTTLTRRAFLATGASAFVASRAGAANLLVDRASPRIAAIDWAPPRIAAIDWAMAETAMALGLPLAALAEKRQFVRGAAITLPDACADLGLRGAPNLEALSLVSPDLILSSNFYSFVEPQLERIAPVYTRSLFVAGEPALPKVLLAMEALADHLDLRAQGQETRAHFETEFDHLAERVSAFADRPFVLMTVGDARHIQVFGADSIYGGALARIGLTNAWAGGTEFGFNAPVPVSKLLAFPDAHLVLVGDVPQNAQRAIRQGALWSALAPVRAGRLLSLSDNNPFGGAPSALRFADHLVTALERA